MYGPRYYYEILPFLLLLTGAGISKFIRFSQHRLTAMVICYSLVVLLTVRLARSWMFRGPTLWTMVNTPSSIWDFRGFNNVNTQLIHEAKRQRISNAVIFVTPCAQWWCDAVPASFNVPTFDSDIIWAKDLGKRNIELFEQFPRRTFFRADYERVTIEPITP